MHNLNGIRREQVETEIKEKLLIAKAAHGYLSEWSMMTSQSCHQL